MRISIIVAAAENGTIGSEGQLPWRLSADLRRFKKLTMGSYLLMGRKTYESIGRLLPGRTTVVITRQAGYEAPGAIVAGSLEEALIHAAHTPEVFVIGGGEIYRQAIPRADRVYFTRVHAQVAGDTHFSALESAAWKLASSEAFAADERNDHPHSFQIYERDPPMASTLSEELLEINQRLLTSIVTGDWKTYAELCDPSISCFEPEARCQLVEGMAFHKYYFDLPAGATPNPKTVTMARPHVRMLGADGAVLSYIRLTQSLDAAGAPQTSRVEETRVWQRIGGQWLHVHFHRSPGA